MSKELINGNYYLISVGLILLAFVVFFFSYERRKPQAREMVTLSVMSAIAIASRAAFAMIPFFKPMSGIIMITGMAFGPGAGFLTGVVSGFVSNFIFGQGPWTPWQMFAYGIGGALAGWLHKKNIMHEDLRIQNYPGNRRADTGCVFYFYHGTAGYRSLCIDDFRFRTDSEPDPWCGNCIDVVAVGKTYDGEAEPDEDKVRDDER